MNNEGNDRVRETRVAVTRAQLLLQLLLLLLLILLLLLLLLLLLPTINYYYQLLTTITSDVYKSNVSSGPRPDRDDDGAYGYGTLHQPPAKR